MVKLRRFRVEILGFGFISDFGFGSSDLWLKNTTPALTISIDRCLTPISQMDDFCAA